MSNILVIGGAGHIGSHLVDRLLSLNNNVTILDNLLTGKKENIPTNKKCEFINGDVNNYDDVSAIMLSKKFDYVFHYGAVVGVTRTLNNPLMVFDDIDGLYNILRLCKNTNVKRIFYASSSEVYGESLEFPQNENTTPINSRLPYAIVKNVGESLLKSFHQEHDLSYTIFRFFNTYGERQTEDFVTVRFIKRALKNEDILIYGDGSQTRTFLYVEDNVDATVMCLTDDLFINDVVNIGNDIEVPIKELAETIIDLTQSKSKIKYIDKLKEGDMARRKPDISKIREHLEFPTTSLVEGIKKTFNL